MSIPINPSLVAECQALVANNDAAHQWNHIQAVMNNGLTIAKLFNLEPLPFILASITHDIFAGTDRDNHELKASEWVLENLAKYGYGEHAVLVSRMVAEHRASYTGYYSNDYCEAFAAADRGPLVYEDAIYRSYLYARSKRGMETDEAIKHAWLHMQEKFGIDGYARTNRFHQKLYEDSLRVFDAAVATTQLSNVREMLKLGAFNETCL